MTGYTPYNYPMYNPMPRVAEAVQPAQQPVSPAFACRPVTSREEAIAVQADYFSPGTLMPDLGHGKIYLKRFNTNTGGSDFLTFVIQEPEPEPAQQFVSAQEMASIRETIDQLRDDVERLKRPRTAVKKDE